MTQVEVTPANIAQQLCTCACRYNEPRVDLIAGMLMVANPGQTWNIVLGR